MVKCGSPDQEAALGKAKVIVSFRKVKRLGKAARKAQEGTVVQVRTGSPLARYLAQEADSGLSVFELVQQFQEYDCEHSWGEPIASTEEKNFFVCDECGLGKTLIRSGSR
jgi:predicted Zn-dependent protease